MQITDLMWMFTAIAAFCAGRLHERWTERRRNLRPRPQPRFKA